MDKQVTRMANSGYPSVLMFGRRWPLTPGTWGVRVPTRKSPDAKPEVYKIDDREYRHPDDVGGRCVLLRRENADNRCASCGDTLGPREPGPTCASAACRADILDGDDHQ